MSMPYKCSVKLLGQVYTFTRGMAGKPGDTSHDIWWFGSQFDGPDSCFEEHNFESVTLQRNDFFGIIYHDLSNCMFNIRPLCGLDLF
jgi:hypothetical protein